MFERRAAGQRIFPSETTAPSMAPAPAPMTISAADLGYLHRVSDDKLEAYEKGCQPPPIQPCHRRSKNASAGRSKNTSAMLAGRPRTGGLFFGHQAWVGLSTEASALARRERRLL